MTKNNIPVFYPVIFALNQAKKFWQGEKSLMAAFWGVGFIGLAILFFLAFLIAKFLGQGYGLVIYATVVILPYMVFVLKSIWACSDNVKIKAFGTLAKIIVALYILRIIAKVAGIF